MKLLRFLLFVAFYFITLFAYCAEVQFTPSSYTFTSNPSYNSAYCGNTRLFDSDITSICKWTYQDVSNAKSATLVVNFSSPVMLSKIVLSLNVNFRNITVTAGTYSTHVSGPLSGSQDFSVQLPNIGETVSSVSFSGYSYIPDFIEITSIQFFKHDSCPCISGSVAQASCQNFLRDKIREVTIGQCKEWSTANPQTYHCDPLSGNSPLFIAKKGDGLLNGSYPYDKFCTCNSGITSYSSPTLSEPVPSSCSSTTTSDGGTTTSGGNTTTSGGGTTTSGGSTTLSLDETNQLLQQILENLTGGSTSGGSSGNGSSNSNQLTSDYCEANKQSWSYSQTKTEYESDCSVAMEQCQRSLDAYAAQSVSYGYTSCNPEGYSCECQIKLAGSIPVSSGGIEKAVLIRNGSNTAVSNLCVTSSVINVFCRNGDKTEKIQMIPGADAEGLCLSIPPVYPAGCQQSGQPISPDDVDDSDGCIAKGGKWVGVVDGVGTCSFGGTQDEDGNVTGGYVIGTGNNNAGGTGGSGSGDECSGNCTVKCALDPSTCGACRLTPELFQELFSGLGTSFKTSLDSTFSDQGTNSFMNALSTSVASSLGSAMTNSIGGTLAEMVREQKTLGVDLRKQGELVLGKHDALKGSVDQSNGIFSQAFGKLGAITEVLENIAQIASCTTIGYNSYYDCNVSDAKVLGELKQLYRFLDTELYEVNYNLESRINRSIKDVHDDIIIIKQDMNAIGEVNRKQNIEIMGKIDENKKEVEQVKEKTEEMTKAVKALCVTAEEQAKDGCKIYSEQLNTLNQLSARMVATHSCYDKCRDFLQVAAGGSSSGGSGSGGSPPPFPPSNYDFSDACIEENRCDMILNDTVTSIDQYYTYHESEVVMQQTALTGFVAIIATLIGADNIASGFGDLFSNDYTAPDFGFITGLQDKIMGNNPLLVAFSSRETVCSFNDSIGVSIFVVKIDICDVAQYVRALMAWVLLILTIVKGFHMLLAGFGGGQSGDFGPPAPAPSGSEFRESGFS